MGHKDKKRPVNLNMMKMKFPIMAITSILHRISGVVIFLSIPFVLYIMQQAHGGVDSYEQLELLLSGAFVKLVCWLLISVFFYHVIAGIRHLILDMGIGEQLRPARYSAWFIVLLEIVVIIAIGDWLW